MAAADTYNRRMNPGRLVGVRACAVLVVVAASCAAGCGRNESPGPTGPGPSPRPSILLVTLDTTRADAVGPDARGVETPALNALIARGRRFTQAYAAVPETLPSHATMLTGLYPAGHGVHENARTVASAHAVAAERLASAGYQTSAFVSSFVLARRFGLARGFTTYDDALERGAVERSARDTTDRAIASWRGATAPVFTWVHYFDPHAPYTPPEPFRTKYAQSPYHGEVAAMDEQIGRLVAAFEQQTPSPHAIVIVGDHGEGLGEHGEALHGNLLYQSTMHVPLVVVGPGITPGAIDAPVSTRRVFHTLLDFSGVSAALSLRGQPGADVVLGEAMKPFLEYGWQPQIMAVDGRRKAIDAGRIEMYDVVADRGEATDLAKTADVPQSLRKALDDYPVPSPSAAAAPESLSDEAKRNLASLGYVSASATPTVRRDAPRPADMTGIFALLDQASGMFVRGEYAAVIPLLERILAADPNNLDATLRLATAHSALGRDARAVALFARAAQLAPESPDVRVYLALHYARGAEWARAVPLLERIVAEMPDRVAPIEALAHLREKQGNLPEAVSLWKQVQALREPTGAEAEHVGTIAMEAGDTATAIAAFERARSLQETKFRRDLELGVLYLSARQFEQARAALDRVPASHPEYAMALFKRAQVSVLLNEPDRAARIERAKRGANAMTRELIANERLFR